MTFIRRYQVRNRDKLLTKAGEIAKSKQKDKKILATTLKVTLLPLYIISKFVQWAFRLPMYICIGAGTVFEYLDELTEDAYHISEDRIFLALYRIMKVKEGE